MNATIIDNKFAKIAGRDINIHDHYHITIGQDAWSSVLHERAINLLLDADQDDLKKVINMLMADTRCQRDVKEAW